MFVGADGKLYKYNSLLKENMEIIGIEVTELWCDAYELNMQKGDQVLFPGEECTPFPFQVEEHVHNREEFLSKGGGYRLDPKVFYKRLNSK